MTELSVINEKRHSGEPLISNNSEVEDQKIQIHESSDSSEDEVDFISFDKLPAGKFSQNRISKLLTLERKQTTTLDEIDHKRPAGDFLKLRNSKTSQHPMVWEDKDIQIDGSQMYENRLITLGIDVICKELIFLCRKKFPNRLSAICKHIKDYRKMKLNQNDFCGEIYDETPLHVAIMSNNEINASILVKYGGKELIFRPYNGKLYDGINSLHLAIVKNMGKLIRNIMELLDDEDRIYLLHFEATCDFITKKLKTSGLPLTLAAWCGNKEIINDLLKYGSQLDKTEMYTGNNVFHSLVKFSDYSDKEKALDTFRYIVESNSFTEWVTNELKKTNSTVNSLDIIAKKKDILEEKNLSGQSVLQHACSRGETHIIEYMLNLPDIYCFPQWECGPVSLKFYDVSLLSSRDLNKNGISGLEYLSYGIHEGNIDILVSEPVKSLIDVKWIQFKKLMVAEVVLHFLMMCILTSFVIYSGYNEKTEKTLASFMIIYCILIILQDLFHAINSIIEICIEKRNLKGFGNVLSENCKISNFYNGEILFNFEVIRLVFAVSSIYYFSAAFSSQAYTKEILAIAAVSGWFYCVYFTRGFKSFGYFQAMMRKMLFSNLLQFSALYIIFLIAFSTAFLCIEKENKANETVYIRNLPHTIFILTRQTLGLFDMGEHINSICPWLYKCLLILFLFLSMILLLNMIIATMTDTYSELTRKKEAFWYKLSLNMITKFERKLPRMIIPKSNLLEYELEVGNGETNTILLLEEKSANMKKIKF